MEMEDYERMCKEFHLKVPKHFNFGFDVIDKWAKGKTRLALRFVDQSGQKQEDYTFQDLSALSNKFANVLKKLSVQKGDRVLLVLPKIPQWYIALLGMIKLNIVPIPVTVSCTSEDIEYRLNQAMAKIIITDFDNIPKIEAIKNKCPSLKALILVGEKRDGWISYETEMEKASRRLKKQKPETMTD